MAKKAKIGNEDEVRPSRVDAGHPQPRRTSGKSSHRSPKSSVATPPRVAHNPPHNLASTPGATGKTPLPIVPTIHVDFFAPDEAFREQAQQLSHTLSEHQRQVDRREATLTGREAELENQLRCARLELQHQQETLEGYERQLKESGADLRSRLAQVAASELASERDQQSRIVELEHREKVLDRREAEIGENEQGLERLSRQLTRREAKAKLEEQRGERELERQRQQHGARTEEDRRQHLRLLRQLERRQRAKTASRPADQAGFVERLAELDERAQDIERRLTLGLSEIKQQWDRFRQSAQSTEARDESRARQLDARQAALAAIQESVTSQQKKNHAALREALDMRMAAELLFRQISKQDGAASTVGQWGELRARLAKLRDEELAQQYRQQRKIAEVARRLAERQQEMRDYRDQLLRWRRDTIAAFEIKDVRSAS
jgi:hypothetical protein